MELYTCLCKFYAETNISLDFYYNNCMIILVSGSVLGTLRYIYG
jgi:hypothetical protein